MNDIFISYQWESKEIVHKIYQLLDNKYKIWIDKDKMRLGIDIYKEMENGINNSKLFIAFITKKYCESDNCKCEIKYVNSLRGNDKKKTIYVMLEKDLGNDLDGVGILIASSLRLNAYEYMVNNNDWIGGVYEILLKAIEALLNENELPKAVLHAIPIDLENLIKCLVCKERFNLEDENDDNSAKPKLISCNLSKAVCLKCIKSSKPNPNSQAFVCPFDGNEHLISSLTNATRLHRIIKLFDTHTYSKTLDDDYNKCEQKLKSSIDLVTEQINSIKAQIDDNVNEIVREMQEYKSKMFQLLDSYANKWEQNLNSYNESFELDKIPDYVKNSEDLFNKLKDNLKQIEISILNTNNNQPYDGLMKQVDENITKLQENVKIYKEGLTFVHKLIDDNVFKLSYKNDRKLINFEEALGVIEHVDLFYNRSFDVKNSNTIMDICDFESNNHLILPDYNCLHILDRNNFEYIKKVDCEHTLYTLCYVKDEEMLCGVESIHGNFLFLNKEYKIIQEYEKFKSKLGKDSLEFNMRKKLRTLLSEKGLKKFIIDFNSKNKCLYICSVTSRWHPRVTSLNFASISIWQYNIETNETHFKTLSDSYLYCEKMKVCNNQIYLVTDKSIAIYDANIDLLTEFDYSKAGLVKPNGIPIFINSNSNNLILLFFEDKMRLYDSMMKLLRDIDFNSESIVKYSHYVLLDDKIVFMVDNKLTVYGLNVI